MSATHYLLLNHFSDIYTRIFRIRKKIVRFSESEKSISNMIYSLIRYLVFVSSLYYISNRLIFILILNVECIVEHSILVHSKANKIISFISSGATDKKFKYTHSSGTRCNGKRVLRSNGCALCWIRRTVWLRSRTLGTRTTREGLSQRSRQPSRVPQVFLSENASAFVYLRKRDSSRSVTEPLISRSAFRKNSENFYLLSIFFLALLINHSSVMRFKYYIINEKVHFGLCAM